MKNTYFALTAVLTAVLLTCENVPEYCGTGELYDPSCAFCYGSQPYIFCENEKREYNPLVQGCVPTTKVVGTRCANDSVVTTGTPCGGYTLTTAVTPENGGALRVFDGRTKFSADEEAILSATPGADYEFAGWAGAQPAGNYAGATYKMTGPNAQVTIVAMFRPKRAGMLITDVFPKGAGTAARSPDKEIYEEGERVTVTAESGSGYAFDGWSGADVSKNNPTTVTMNESKTLVAIFTPAIYTLRASVSPANSGAVYIDNTAVSSGDETRKVGRTVGVFARADEGFTFLRWEGGNNASFYDVSNPLTTATVGADAAITAVFERGGDGTVDPPLTDTETKYAVTVVSAGTGAGGGGGYAGGKTVTIVAGTPQNGYTFYEWTTASYGVVFKNPGSAETWFTMPTNDVTVTANFFEGGQVDTTESVTIAGKTWMKKNLNIETADSRCYDDSPDSCAKYGRLYTWNAAMTACPNGWHLPSRQEWQSLVDYAGGDDAAGKKLKSTSGWNDYDGQSGNGTDDFGFSALSGGYEYSGDGFDYTGYFGYWWTATDIDGSYAYYRIMNYLNDFVNDYSSLNGYAYSVRCVKDD